MDPTLVGVLVVSVTGNMVQLALRLMGKQPAKPEISDNIVGVIKGQIALHAVECPSLRSVMDRLTSIDKKLDEHVQFHLTDRK